MPGISVIPKYLYTIIQNPSIKNIEVGHEDGISACFHYRFDDDGARLRALVTFEQA